jgi:DNA-directed RNA polymerase subunit M/transcription elongation factor TFIIS
MFQRATRSQYNLFSSDLSIWELIYIFQRIISLMDEQKNFIKNTEDFTCENCGQKVKGCGYTNHCPHCLYSKHVDNVPGDRANPCGGLMAPARVEYDGGDYVIVHKCLKCRTEKRNKTASDDNFDELARINQDFRV